MPKTAVEVAYSRCTLTLVSNSSGFQICPLFDGKSVVAPSIPWARNQVITCVLLLIMAAVLWQVPIARPLDMPSWHEFDTSAIARNFLREPGSILNPRIDWRRDGPGFTESEFPLHSWLIALAYRSLSTNVIWGRLLSLSATLGSLVMVILIARGRMSQAGVITAALLFTLNKLTSYVATALQPEAFMLFFYLAGIYAFLCWRESKSRWAYWLASARRSNRSARLMAAPRRGRWSRAPSTWPLLPKRWTVCATRISSPLTNNCW